MSNTSSCGCCDGISYATPIRINNRAGLSTINYRVGRHAAFRASMLAGLAASENVHLRRLLTREPDDFTIALIDAWATALDVLTFYNEWIANEHYLRTATERLSLLQLARTIGYELRPGVAANTALAFSCEETPGAPAEAMIDIGVKVQSVPGPGEQAQTFETIEAIVARGAWNGIRPRQTAPQTLSASMNALWVAANSNLKAGDALLIVASQSAGTAQALRRVASIARDDANNRALVLLEPAVLSPTSGSGSETGVWAMRVKAAPFGHNAPLVTKRDNNGNVTDTDEWDLASTDEGSLLTLDALHEQVVAGGWVVIDRPEPPWWSSVLATSAYSASSIGGVARMVDSTPSMASRSNVSSISSFGSASRAASSASAAFQTLNTLSYISLYSGRRHIFARATSVRASSRADYGITGRGTQITLDTDWSLNDATLSFARDTMIYAQSEPLDLVEAPLAETLARNAIELVGDYRALVKGRLLAWSGQAAGSTKNSPLLSEVAEVAGVEFRADGVSVLTLANNLSRNYRRSTTTLNANVARASHGETMRETLGSADASRVYQHFTLKGAPLTFLSAANAAGSTTTLALRVNDLLWHEAATLYNRGPTERVYTTRTGDEGKTTVQFGDGRNGARPPSGAENVRAVYRRGSGTAGNVKAGQLSMLMSRPLGLKGVANPTPANGGVDAEQRDEARQNAPLTVMTLDRIVSLRDYEDFARAFRGVAKALATWTWDGRQRGVFVTVAGADGAELASSSPTYQNLVTAMRNAGDPHVPLRVATYRPARFTLVGQVIIHPDYLAANVREAILATLAAQYGFAARAFGQPVALSEVMAAIQRVAGAVAVDIDRLAREDGVGGTGLVPLLPAAQPQVGASSVQAAELLTLGTATITI